MINFLVENANICNGIDVEIIKVLRFIFMLLDYVFILVPIGLILMVSLDFAKNVIANKEDEMKKNLNVAIKRIIFCVALFLVQPIVTFSINLLGDIGVDFASCIEFVRSDKNIEELETCPNCSDSNNQNTEIDDGMNKNKEI